MAGGSWAHAIAADKKATAAINRLIQGDSEANRAPTWGIHSMPSMLAALRQKAGRQKHDDKDDKNGPHGSRVL